MADTVEQIHRPYPQQHDEQNREPHVDAPQHLGCRAYARAQFLVDNACHLRVEHLHAPRVVEHRQNGQSEHDDSHAADPLHQRAPDSDRM